MTYDVTLALVRHLEVDGPLPPTMAAPLWHLTWHFWKLGLRLPSILAASDEALLEARGFGPRSLAVFRQRVPGGPASRFAFMDDLLWREHAEMVAVAR